MHLWYTSRYRWHRACESLDHLSYPWGKPTGILAHYLFVSSMPFHKHSQASTAVQDGGQHGTRHFFTVYSLSNKQVLNPENTPTHCPVLSNEVEMRRNHLSFKECTASSGTKKCKKTNKVQSGLILLVLLLLWLFPSGWKLQLPSLFPQLLPPSL